MRAVMTMETKTLVSVYQRTVRASLERIWENVLDWEHLPHLHWRSFAAIKVLESSPEGWRARVTMAPREAARESVVEVEVDRPQLRYLTRTVDGFGEGAEILTYIDPRAEHGSRIAVEFRVPGVDSSRAPEVGAAYNRLYARLWDEDEAMMIRRQMVLDHEGGLFLRERRSQPRPLEAVRVGRETEVRRKLPLIVNAHGRKYRIVELQGRLLAHPLVCPHRGGPLDEAAIENGCITCPWHGYRYDVLTGRNLDGHALTLERGPTVLVDRRDAEVVLLFPKPRPS